MYSNSLGLQNLHMSLWRIGPSRLGGTFGRFGLGAGAVLSAASTKLNPPPPRPRRLGAKDNAATELKKPDTEEEAKGAKDNAATEPKKSDTEEDDGLDADESATKSKNSTRVVKIWFHKTGSEVKKTNEASKEVKEMLEKLKPNLTMRVSPRHKEEREKIDCPSDFPPCRSKKSLS